MTDIQIKKAGLLWFAGFNTKEIAERLKPPENAVHARIEFIKIEAYLAKRAA